MIRKKWLREDLDALLDTEQPQDPQTSGMAVCFDGTDRLRQPWLSSMRDHRAQEWLKPQCKSGGGWQKHVLQMLEGNVLPVLML